jgi:hypothetical protein
MTLAEETLSESEVLDHELNHADAQINGEAIEGGAVRSTYRTSGGYNTWSFKNWLNENGTHIALAGTYQTFSGLLL